MSETVVDKAKRRSTQQIWNKFGSVGRVAAMIKSHYDPCKLAFEQMSKMSILEANVRDIRNKRVLVRADFDVPMQNGKILNNHKIVAALPTVRYLIEKRAKAVIIISHLGQPGGRPVSEFRYKVLLSRSSLLPPFFHLIHNKVKFLLKSIYC